MIRPVILGASVCGLLLVGLVTRPTFWTGGGGSTITPGSLPQPIVTDVTDMLDRDAPVARTYPQWTAHYRAFSHPDLQLESEILWHRAMAIQTELHANPSSANREFLLAQLESVVEQSRAVHVLLEQ